MFEKEAKEYRRMYGITGGCDTVFKDGAEYGYNLAKEEIDYLDKHWKSKEERKVNEWHYVKNELPIGKPYQHGTKAFVTVAYINNYNVPKKLDCYYWDNEFLCDSTYGYKKVEDVYGKVYAWKYEDKLPELPKENG